jgi:molybdopterin-binding protein
MGTFISSARNVHKGTVTDIIASGSKVFVTVDIGISIKALITEKSLREMRIEKGTELYASLRLCL